jgi:hypothetical protein
LNVVVSDEKRRKRCRGAKAKWSSPHVTMRCHFAITIPCEVPWTIEEFRL